MTTKYLNKIQYEKYNNLWDTAIAVRQELSQWIFENFILPKVKMYKWDMDWAMGSVSFTRNGEEIENKTTRRIFSICNDLYGKVFSLHGCNGLWWVMSNIQVTGRYVYGKGFQQYD